MKGVTGPWVRRYLSEVGLEFSILYVLYPKHHKAEVINNIHIIVYDMTMTKCKFSRKF